MNNCVRSNTLSQYILSRKHYCRRWNEVYSDSRKRSTDGQTGGLVYLDLCMHPKGEGEFHVNVDSTYSKESDVNLPQTKDTKSLATTEAIRRLRHNLIYIKEDARRQADLTSRCCCADPRRGRKGKNHGASQMSGKNLLLRKICVHL